MVKIPGSLLKAAASAITAANKKFPGLWRAGFAPSGEAPEPLNREGVAVALAFIKFGPCGNAKVPWGAAAGRLAYFARRWSQALEFDYHSGVQVGDFLCAAFHCGIKCERPLRNESGIALRLLDCDRDLVDAAFVKLLAACSAKGGAT